MGEQLELVRILTPAHDGAGGGKELVLGANGSPEEALVVTTNGTYSVIPATDALPPGASRLAWISPLPEAAGALRAALVPTAPGFQADGVDLIGLTVLRQGTLLSAPGSDWLVARRWWPERRQAPAGLARSSCPICGMELSLESVCSCACGCLYHLETLPGEATADADDPRAEAAEGAKDQGDEAGAHRSVVEESKVSSAGDAGDGPLNCFLEAKICSNCKEEMTLEPRLIPDPRELRLL